MMRIIKIIPTIIIILLKNGYNEKCDLWSCGVILYILLCGSPPFYGKNEKEIFQKILDGEVDFKHKIWNKISEDAKNLVTKLLQVDPNERISAAKALEDIWFKKNLNLNVINDNPTPTNFNMFMNNITQFCAEQKLQQATLAFLVHNFAPKEELNELKKIFFAFDKNGDGKLSKEEFVTGLTNIDINFNLNLKEEESLNSLIKNIDSDNNGYITFEEFLIASVNKEKILTENNLKINGKRRIKRKSNKYKIYMCYIRNNTIIINRGWKNNYRLTIKSRSIINFFKIIYNISSKIIRNKFNSKKKIFRF